MKGGYFEEFRFKTWVIWHLKHVYTGSPQYSRVRFVGFYTGAVRASKGSILVAFF